MLADDSGKGYTGSLRETLGATLENFVGPSQFGGGANGGGADGRGGERDGGHPMRRHVQASKDRNTRPLVTPGIVRPGALHGLRTCKVGVPT